VSDTWVNFGGAYRLTDADGDERGRVTRHGAGRSHWDALFPDGTSATTTSLSAAKALVEAWEPDDSLTELDLGDGRAEPEENFWDDRTTPLAYAGELSGEYDGELAVAGESGRDDDDAGDPSGWTVEQLVSHLIALGGVLDGDAAAPQAKGYGTTSPGTDQKEALKRLRGLARLRSSIEIAIIDQVDEARKNTGNSWYPNSATWELVGAALGVAKQSAATRYGGRKD
jgi:hypothetical protein